MEHKTMKKLIPITIILICFFQAGAFAGTSLNARINIEIPNYVRADKEEKRISNHKIKNDDYRTVGNEEKTNVVAEVPAVTSNCRWNVVVMNEKTIMNTGNYSEQGAENSATLQNVAADAAETLIGSGKSDSGSKAGNPTRELELSYTFFAD